MSETYAECPVFAPFERGSIAFALQLHLRVDGAEPGRSAYRISRIHDRIQGRDGNPELTDFGPAQELFKPSRSFLDDITNGRPGVNGRPLVFLAEARAEDEPPPLLHIRRPASWDYEFENANIRLDLAPRRQRIAASWHEHFCVFESGRVFYILVLSSDAGDGADGDTAMAGFDEYSMIHALQPVMQRDLASDSEYLGIDHAGETHSLIGFMASRLAQLSAGSDRPNAFTHILRPFGLAGGEVPYRAPVARDLCNAMVQVEDDLLFATAMHTYRHYQTADEDGVAAATHPDWLVERDRAWRQAHENAGTHALGLEDGGDVPLPILAFAGLTQGVPDYPRQDDSEIHDSTRPVSVALENLFFVHPRFEFEVGKNWRTFSEASETVGACPYALLTWLISVHDELIVSDMEEMIEDMMYETIPPRAPNAALGRTVPLGNLRGLLDRVAHLIPSRQRIIDNNLANRLDIFRWCSIHQTGKVFRYPTERELLEAIREARGTRQRFDDAHALLDRYENLVEDVASLSAAYASSRTNWLLAAITIFSIAELPAIIGEMFEQLGIADRYANAAAFALILGTALLFWIRNRPQGRKAAQLSRSRKSS